MVTKTGTADLPAVASRLAMLEAVVEHLKVPQDFDMSQFITSFDRLYTMTMKGAVNDPDDPISYKYPDEKFYFHWMDASLVTLTLGEKVEDFNLQGKSLVERVLNSDEQGRRTENRSLLELTIGDRAGPDAQTWGFESASSLAHAVFGTYGPKKRCLTEKTEEAQSSVTSNISSPASTLSSRE